ncbi:glycine/D-amino acid oxidase-like deaminating enzyme [Pontibacter ummariensis]|uniref:Glycine/D-amino acid oxidase n=1 Tax=Pontibacter ummariensis TaxID=1610492 RepID=A0A239CPM5_9BACT|nr:FAD-dependent oxidoreductase [Pontibacter ummariensis]PRY14916.1 glycine/D-amino acid oxidase-like deaminating enzyme [Pontibacter ummariensis]SNS21641.1 Glycine/D-amino acid oxidase [Pontibacter ummariensis]
MEKQHITEALWSGTTAFKEYPLLPGDIEVDVAIVGAGITGISTAYTLAKAGKRVAVLEALKVGSGTTGSSTGNLYAPIDERLHSVETKFDEETMRTVAAARTAAIDFIEKRVQEYNIDCEFNRVPWYLFTTPETSSQNSQVEKELEASKKAGLPVSGEAPANFPYEVSAITNIAHQAQFNPLKYVQHLAAAIVGDNCQIYEGTKVTQVEDGEPCVVHTQHGKVTARHVVMATHSPKGIYAVHTEMEPYREYAMAVRLKGDPPAGGIYWHQMAKQHHSVRPYSNAQGNFLLVLGEPHRVGHKEHNEDSFLKIEEYMTKHFDVDHIVYKWAAQNYKPADNLPYIGTSLTQDHTYIATGFAADGLTWGTVSSMIIHDLIVGKENEWARTFDPKRFTPVASSKKFMQENVHVAKHLIKDYFFYDKDVQLKDLKPGEGKTLEIDDEKLAAYRDEEGKLHVVSSVCTHMGCVVHFNNAEKSWDCPCHGSRFSVEGEVLEGPAYDNLAKPNTTKNEQ